MVDVRRGRPLASGALALVPMRPRDPDEPHRAASPLELFFDLVFVVAVSFSSSSLHHLQAEGHAASGAVAYLAVFFAVWWAWMGFTWFASSFATDDWLYRVTTFVQMGGVLVLAAGADAAMAHGDFTLVTAGYVVMRLAVVGQWLRAAAGGHALRATALRFAAGTTAVQLAWVLRLLLPPAAGTAAFVVLVAAELAVPVWAERRASTPWHAAHIAERYGLFTLILLGESLLASTAAVVAALEGGEHLGGLAVLSVSALATTAGLWWTYFAREHDVGRAPVSSFSFGYLHYVVFAAAGAFPAGVEVAVDVVTGEVALPRAAAAAALAVPVALFLVSTWWLTLRGALTARGRSLFAAGVVVVVASTVLPEPAVAWTALGTVLAVLGTEVSAAARQGR